MRLENLSPEEKQALESCFESSDLKIQGDIHKGGYGENTLTVKFVGEVLLEELQPHEDGMILYSDEYKIILKGIIDGRLILEMNNNDNE